MSQADSSPATEILQGRASQGKKSRPSKIFPTDRIAFSKQLDLLRAYAAVSGPAGVGIVTNNDVAPIVKLNPATVSLANSFFADMGFLQKADGGYIPSPEVVSFGRAYEWNPETATHRLAPLIEKSWFGQVLMPKLRFGPLDESTALRDLADAAAVGLDYKPQLGFLLEYMQAAGLISREGGMLRRTQPETQSTASAADTVAVPSHPASKDLPGRVPAVSTVFSKPTEGTVQFHVSVRVDMAEFAGWPADRIAAFFSGIAQVLAAKGNVEERASMGHP